MCSKIYLVKLFVVKLILTTIQGLEQNHYYNWQQMQPINSQVAQSTQNPTYFYTQLPMVGMNPNLLRGHYYNNVVPSLLPKQETEGHGQTSEIQSGDGGLQTQGYQTYGYGMNSVSQGYSSGYGGYGNVGNGTEPDPVMKEMQRLGPDGILKILLTILPVIVCLIFVPSLVITVGLLLIPVIQWGDYFDDNRSLNEKLQDKILENIWKFKV